MWFLLLLIISILTLALYIINASLYPSPTPKTVGLPGKYSLIIRHANSFYCGFILKPITFLHTHAKNLKWLVKSADSLIIVSDYPFNTKTYYITY